MFLPCSVTGAALRCSLTDEAVPDLVVRHSAPSMKRGYRVAARDSRAAASTASAVMPNSSNSRFASAEAP